MIVKSAEKSVSKNTTLFTNFLTAVTIYFLRILYPGFHPNS